MSFKRRLKGKTPPEGWELIEKQIDDYESQMRDAVNEDHEGKRKNENTWRIHRIHFEKNRFIFDLMYKRQAMSKELARASPTARTVHPRLASYFKSSFPPLQYEYLVREKIADGGLIAKWRKPGYENLCSMLAIQKGDHNFGAAP